jgi:hypothetical protein
MLERISVLPDGCIEAAPRRLGNRLVHVLAEGEQSGHAHQVPAGPGTRLLQGRAPHAAGPEAYLELAAPARLLHEEHAPIDLPAGTYRVVQQRRYDPRRAVWRRAGD